MRSLIYTVTVFSIARGEFKESGDMTVRSVLFLVSTTGFEMGIKTLCNV